MTSERVILGELGTQVYVTLAAAREYARARSLGEEEGRKELTRLLLRAHCTQEYDAASDRLSAWRYRSRSAGVDITARIVRDGELLIVTAVSVRMVR